MTTPTPQVKPILMIDPAHVSREFGLQAFIALAEECGYLVLLTDNPPHVARIIGQEGVMWQTMETAPYLDGEVVLVWDIENGVQPACWDRQEQEWLSFDGDRVDDPAYWRPLPFGPLKVT